MKIKLEDVSVKDGTWTQISLAKLTGQHIKDIQGYVSTEFGNDEPVFNITRIVLGNGEKISVDGEHDIAYINASDEHLNLDDETLIELYYQENPEEREEDEDYE